MVGFGFRIDYYHKILVALIYQFKEPVANFATYGWLLQKCFCFIHNKDVHGMDEDVSRFDRYDALVEDGPPRIETDKIRKWQEEQKERLVAKGISF